MVGGKIIGLGVRRAGFDASFVTTSFVTLGKSLTSWSWFPYLEILKNCSKITSSSYEFMNRNVTAFEVILNTRYFSVGKEASISGNLNQPLF